MKVMVVIEGVIRRKFRYLSGELRQRLTPMTVGRLARMQQLMQLSIYGLKFVTVKPVQFCDNFLRTHYPQHSRSEEQDNCKNP